MGWIYKVKVRPACTHPELPNVEKYGQGSIWECDNCRQRFQIEVAFRARPLPAYKVWMPYG